MLSAASTLSSRAVPSRQLPHARRGRSLDERNVMQSCMFGLSARSFGQETVYLSSLYSKEWMCNVSPIHTRYDTHTMLKGLSVSRRPQGVQSSAAAFGSTLGCVRHEVRYRCQAVTSPSIQLLLRCHSSGHEAHGPWQLLRSSVLASSCHGMSHQALAAACCARGVEACTAVNSRNIDLDTRTRV